MSPNIQTKNRFDVASHYDWGFYERAEVSDVDLSETDSGFHFEFKIPGYVKSDFNFYVTNNDLVVTTERAGTAQTNKTEANEISKHRYCYPSAYFKKRFHLPDNIATDKISMDYKNGKLSFDLPIALGY